jgi:hypothetical protein
MNERNQKGSSADRVPTRIVDRASALRTPLNRTPVVADSSTGTWKKYCADRLRHFAAGR